MTNRRETHIERAENRAKRHLEDSTRRWPSDPRTILTFLVIAMVIILLLWLF